MNANKELKKQEEREVAPEAMDVQKQTSEIQKMQAELYIHSANSATSKSVWAYMLLIIVCITAIMANYNENFSFTEQFLKMSEYVHNPELREKLKERQKKDEAASKEDARQEPASPDGSAAETVPAGPTAPIDSTVSPTPAGPAPGTPGGPEMTGAAGTTPTAAKPAATSAPHFEVDKIHGRMMAALIDNFVESQYFTFPIIGIKVATADVITILSICLLLAVLWCYICIKNENLIVGKVLNRTYGYPRALRQYILSGIGFKNVFFPISYRKRPYRHLRLTDDGTTAILAEMRRKEERYRSNMLQRQRAIAIALFCLPLVVSLFGIFGVVFDLYSFEGPGIHALYRLGGDPELYKEASEYIHYERNIRVVLAFSIAVFIAMAYCFWRIVQCLSATSQILFDYKNSIKCEMEFDTVLSVCRKKVKYEKKQPSQSDGSAAGGDGSAAKDDGSAVGDDDGAANSGLQQGEQGTVIYPSFELKFHSICDPVIDPEHVIYAFSIFMPRGGKYSLAGIKEIEQIQQHLCVVKRNACYQDKTAQWLLDELLQKMQKIQSGIISHEIRHVFGESDRTKRRWSCLLLKFNE